ncbi:MAG: cupin protein [Burkholderiales bacterium]|jgi:quercetin dioxygenase-like cupin family protein|nr:cupin protein [Burkholderiales bacterium]
MTTYKTELQVDKVKGVLVSAPGLKVIKLKIHAGSELSEHHSNSTVVIVCVDGDGIFTIGFTQHEIKTGEVIYMKPFEKHSVKAITDLTLIINHMDLVDLSQNVNKNNLDEN